MVPYSLFKRSILFRKTHYYFIHIFLRDIYSSVIIIGALFTSFKDQFNLVKHTSTIFTYLRDPYYSVKHISTIFTSMRDPYYEGHIYTNTHEGHPNNY